MSVSEAEHRLERDRYLSGGLTTSCWYSQMRNATQGSNDFAMYRTAPWQGSRRFLPHVLHYS